MPIIRPKPLSCQTALEGIHLPLDDYYAERGWDAGGIPTREKLEALGVTHHV